MAKDWSFCGLNNCCTPCEQQAEALAEAAVWQETVKQLEKMQE